MYGIGYKVWGVGCRCGVWGVGFRLLALGFSCVGFRLIILSLLRNLGTQKFVYNDRNLGTMLNILFLLRNFGTMSHERTDVPS